jgi:hypothetical protein
MTSFAVFLGVWLAQSCLFAFLRSIHHIIRAVHPISDFLCLVRMRWPAGAMPRSHLDVFSCTLLNSPSCDPCMTCICVLGAVRFVWPLYRRSFALCGLFRFRFLLVPSLQCGKWKSAKNNVLCVLGFLWYFVVCVCVCCGSEVGWCVGWSGDRAKLHPYSLSCRACFPKISVFVRSLRAVVSEWWLLPSVLRFFCFIHICACIRFLSVAKPSASPRFDVQKFRFLSLLLAV